MNEYLANLHAQAMYDNGITPSNLAIEDAVKITLGFATGLVEFMSGGDMPFKEKIIETFLKQFKTKKANDKA